MNNLFRFLFFFGAGLYWVHALVPLVLLGLMCIVGFIRTNGKVQGNAFWVALISLTVLIALVSGVATAFHSGGIETTLRVTFTPILAILAFSLNRPSGRELVTFLGVIGIGSTIAGMLMYVQTGPFQFDVSLSRILGLNRSDGYWLLGSYYEGAPSISGPLGVGGILCFAGALLTSGVMRGAFTMSVMAAVMMLLLSISRGATAALLLAAVVTIFLLQFSRRSFKGLGAQFALVGFVIVAGYVAFSLALEFIPGAEARYAVLTSGLGSDRSMAERFEVWIDSFKLAAHNPFGLGYRYWMDGALGGYSAHNEFLGTLVASGFIGFVAFLALAFATSLVVLRSLQDYSQEVRSVCLMLIGALSFYMVLGMTQHFSVSSPRLLYPVFWMLVGIAARLAHRQGKLLSQRSRMEVHAVA